MQRLLSTGRVLRQRELATVFVEKEPSSKQARASGVTVEEFAGMMADERVA